MYNINEKLVIAVIEHESQFRQYVVSETNDRGYMQLNPDSFPQYSLDELFDPRINISEGVKYLAKMRRQCPHKVDDTFIICYNLGVTGGSRVKHPKLFKYYKETMKLVNRE